MPEVVATSGAAPHYTPPRLDGGRPGTFWFNTERPGCSNVGHDFWSRIRTDENRRALIEYLKTL